MHHVFTTVVALQNYLRPFINEKKTIGFVPTMGALHQGHLSLLERSLQENNVSVISIFVNPTQFNNSEDLAKYPRTLEADITLVEKLSAEVVVFTPEATDLYNGAVVSNRFNFGGIEKVMEGSSRPGHFDGVGTVVNLLFKAVRPTRAYFGEKDFQQIAIVRKMVELTNSNVIIESCPVVRHENGLAMSSRNARLSASAKEEACFIFNVLEVARTLFLSHSVQEVEMAVHTLFSFNKHLSLEYFTIANEQTLTQAITKELGVRYRAFVVAHIEGVRLIDNAPLY